jgi:TRAP-type mannitol/chloroaromatic compound transport system permease small subunit
VSAARQLADGIDSFIDLVGRAISWLALVVAVVMGANVFMRYGFSIGEIWAQELEWHILVPLTLVGMSYALRHGEHVRVDVLFANFSARNKLAVDAASAVICRSPS